MCLFLGTGYQHKELLCRGSCVRNEDGGQTGSSTTLLLVVWYSSHLSFVISKSGTEGLNKLPKGSFCHLWIEAGDLKGSLFPLPWPFHLIVLMGHSIYERKNLRKRMQCIIVVTFLPKSMIWKAKCGYQLIYRSVQLRNEGCNPQRTLQDMGLFSQSLSWGLLNPSVHICRCICYTEPSLVSASSQFWY